MQSGSSADYIIPQVKFQVLDVYNLRLFLKREAQVDYNQVSEETEGH